MREISYETNLYPEDPIELKVFNYSEEELQDRLSSLLDRGYKLSQHYVKDTYLPMEELKQRIEDTKKEIGIISSILTPEETFQTIENKLNHQNT